MPASASAIAAPDRCRSSPAISRSTSCETSLRRRRRAGLECELLDAHAAHEAEPQLAPDVSGALFMKSHGFVVTASLSGALSAAAIKHGARVRVPARARRIEHRGDHVDAHLDNDTPVTAHHVVIAAGSWSGHIDIDGIPPLPVRPIRGQLLQLASAARDLNRIVWGPRCYLVPVGRRFDSRWRHGRRRRIRRAHDCCRCARSARRRVRSGAACARSDVCRRASGAAARDGRRDAHHRPLRRMPGLVYATGHYRNGVLLAPLTARAVADLVLDNREDPLLAPAAPQRFGEC